jgi:predicted O-methyltransferase YrrM
VSLPHAALDLDLPALSKADDDRFMTEYERRVLVALLYWIKAKTVIEIGVQRGHCARVLLDHVPTIRWYLGIDVEPGYKTGLSVQQTEVPDVAGDLVLQERRFRLKKLRHGSFDLTELPSCDVVLIDGDHGASAVSHDSHLAFKCVRPGGLILWHDYWPPFANDVVVTLEKFRGAGRDIQHIADTWLAIEVQKAI